MPRRKKASKSPEKAEDNKTEEQSAEQAAAAESPKKGKGRKPAKETEDGEVPGKRSKAGKAEAKTKLRKEASLTEGMDFSHDCQTKDGSAEQAAAAESPKKGRGRKPAKGTEDGVTASKSPEKAEENKTEEQSAEQAAAAESPKKGKGRKPAKGTEDGEAASKSPEKAEENKTEEQSAEQAAAAESPKKGKGRKPAKGTEDGEAPAKKSKAGKAEVKTKLRKEASLTEGMDFSHDCQTKDGRKPNWKIASWNVNGIRAWMDKGGLSYINDEKPDVLCLQETKCALDDLPSDVKVEGYYDYWSSAEQAGYAGTGIYSKTKPINVTYGLDIKKHDSEGRVITAEYDKFFLVTSYVPNAGRGLPRLPYRSKEWDVDFREYLNKLNKTKPVIMCGDLNVAHLEIDLKNPKTNKKTAGFTMEERQGFTDLLAEGYIDSYRELYPETEGAYSFWTYMGNARGKNVGWRLDYFVLSEKLKEDLCDNVIRKDVMGSDHCPIVLYMAIK